MLTAEQRQITYDRTGLSNEKLLELYLNLLKPRMIEEKMLILLRQGKVSKWFSGIGQEAISVGAAMALHSDEFILPMHRNLGIFTTRKMPLAKLFAQFQGKKSGYTKGRDRSFHFGDKEHKIVGMISHLGPQMGVADGIALADLLKGNKHTTIVFTGDGATSEGDFHESINVAAVWNLPVIFLIENNGYGLPTPSREQFKCEYFVDKAKGYGIEGELIAGNNIIEVYKKLSEIAESIRQNPRPVIAECLTFRMRGHEEASGTKYVPNDLMEEWAAKDPLSNFENFLLAEGVLNDELIEQNRAEIKVEIDEAINIAFNEPELEANINQEVNDVYAPYTTKKFEVLSKTKTEKRFIDAISDGLRQSMIKHQNLVLMGQDIAEYGGVFKITDGFVAEFGKGRVRNTPLCESAILGAGLGLAINGHKAMVEMQFADFVSEGMTQIINNLAKIYYRWGQNADVVVRMPTGAGSSGGPFHSQSNEAWFVHTPGLKVVYPAFPSDAKGLLTAAFDDPNPVIYFEHKVLYRSIKEEIFDEYYTVEIGKANLLRKGNDVTIITYGFGVHWAIKVLDENPNINADLIDLRTLLPFDKDAIFESVKKTGRVIILHEDTLTGGIGGEISAVITEECFSDLDAPVMRCASMDTPVPFTANLEKQFLPDDRFLAKLKELLAY
jgi:2-oxoisovalerate dehydrogenase E1 component